MPILKPARPKLLVPFPGSPKRYLSEKGEHVELDQYWHRALSRGDVVLADEPAPVAGSGTKSRTSDAKS